MNIIRFCNDNNLSNETYQRLRYFIYCVISNPYYQTTPMDSWNCLLFFDNSEMETDKDTYYYLSYEADRIYLYHSNSRGNLKLNYINIKYDVIYSILIILQGIFPKIQINDNHQIRGELNMKIVHHLFYLIEKHNIPLCFDVIIQKRKALKLSEKLEFTTICDCCGTTIGDITHGSNEDHIRELQYFGTNDIDNFQLLCLDCHSYKTKLNTKKKRKLEETIPMQSKRRKTSTTFAL